MSITASVSGITGQGSYFRGLSRRRLVRRGVSQSAATPVVTAGTSPYPAVLGGEVPPRVIILVREFGRVSASSRSILFGLLAGLGLAATAVSLTTLGPEHSPRPGWTLSAPVPLRRQPSLFLAKDAKGFVFLDSKGNEKERLVPPISNGALSPDGRRFAGLEFDKDMGRSRLVIRTLGAKEVPVILPLALGGRPGRSGGQALWSRDGERIMNWEHAVEDDETQKWAYWVYTLKDATHVPVDLPDGCAIRDWSLDGKRFLVDVNLPDGTVRMAWFNADGRGKPESITPEGENGFDGRLSSDGKRVLFRSGPKPPDGRRGNFRLTVLDVATGKRTVVDEPGETHGHCWSPDGKRIAYTWQKPLPPEGTRSRETFLITVSADGTDRKTITSRKYEIPKNSDASPDAVITFFWVHEWR